jgi:hypothetical protein
MSLMSFSMNVALSCCAYYLRFEFDYKDASETPCCAYYLPSAVNTNALNFNTIFNTLLF